MSESDEYDLDLAEPGLGFALCGLVNFTAKTKVTVTRHKST